MSHENKQRATAIYIAGAIVLALVFTLVGCGDTFNQSASGHGTNIADVQNADTETGGETPYSEPVSVDGAPDNPYNCPEGTTIRSDCSVVSQQTCVCMLP